MKAWALALVVMVGCYQPKAPYQPSASERFVVEKEALDQLLEVYEPLGKARIEATVYKEPEAIKRFESLKDDYELVSAALEKQRDRYSNAVRELAE